MRRRRVLLTGLTLTIIGLIAAVAVAFAAGRAGSEPAQLLRLNDLALGYQPVELEEEHGRVADCHPLTEPDDTPPRMLAFIRRYHPRGCIFGFQFTYGEPEAKRNPLLIGSGVLDAKSTAEIGAAWAVVPEMLGRLIGDRVPQKQPSPAKIGSQTRLYHVGAPILGGKKPTKISFLVWSSGTMLGAVMTAGNSFAVDDAAAAELAQRQQAHFAKPSRLKPIENYDGEVALENPAVDLPVYWLGRRFKPGGNVPEAVLGSSWFIEKPVAERHERGYSEGPLPKLHLTYYQPIDLTLSTWGPADWSTYAGSKTGKAIVTWKCTKTKTLEVPGGTATIYAGYKQDYAKCPTSAPEAFTAWVRYGEDTVVVDAPFGPESIEVKGPWASFTAMEAVVEALRPRAGPSS